MTTQIVVHVADTPVEIESTHHYHAGQHYSVTTVCTTTLAPGAKPYSFHAHSDLTVRIREIHTPRELPVATTENV